MPIAEWLGKRGAREGIGSVRASTISSGEADEPQSLVNCI